MTIEITKQQAIYIACGVAVVLLLAALVIFYFRSRRPVIVDAGVKAAQDPIVEAAGKDHAAQNDMFERQQGSDAFTPSVV